MIRVVLVRPGTTDFDEQRRIKGNLDIPLNQFGTDQVARTANELSGQGIEVIYSSPCRAAQETSRLLAHTLLLKVRTVANLRNLDHGLWQGKLIDEVKTTQRKVYRQWQEQPLTVCPPEGETLEAAGQRVQQAVDKVLKKHKSGVIAVVVSEPMATLVRCYLGHGHLGDLWRAETSCGSWEVIDVAGVMSLESSSVGSPAARSAT
jgi:probable phosphoglycerate mutase